MSRPVFDFLQTLGNADADPLVPLSESESAGIQGIYGFGPAINRQVEVTVDHGEAIWTRKGRMGRQLFIEETAPSILPAHLQSASAFEKRALQC